MYIRYNDKDYKCKCTINKSSIIYRNLPDNFPETVSGKIVLYADDGFELRADNVKDYLRYTYSNGTFTLTNTPEPEPVTVDDTPTKMEQLRADVDYIAVMTGVEL